MTEIITINSFRRGAGKSSLVSNLAVLLVKDGYQVAVIDTDYQAPSLHLFFGLPDEKIPHSLNDYLNGKCDITDTLVDITSSLNIEEAGHAYLISASIKTSDIMMMLRNPYDFTRFNNGLNKLIEKYELDVVLLDTTAGLNEETLVSIALANTLLVLLHPDQQDYQGTAVTVEVANNLKVPRICLVLNDTPATLDMDNARVKLEKTYQCEVVGILPHSDIMLTLASAHIFALQQPNHPYIVLFQQLLDRLMAS